MAEMPPDVHQRSQWGFYSWWAGDPEKPFPDSFVSMAYLMGAELPDYFRKAQFITTGQIITAEGAAAIYEGEAFPWTTSVPMVALDGRLAKFMVGKWGLDIHARFGAVQELIQATAMDGLYTALVDAHNKLIDEHLMNLSIMQVLAQEARDVGVPVLDDGESPMFMMVPVTVLEDWASMLIDTSALVEDARASVEAGEPIGIVATLREEVRAEEKRRVRGPVLVGIAAIGLTVFGMFMAVRTGRVSRGTQAQ
jgi:hypothetical protein